MTDWKAQRLGPSFTAAEISLRDAVERTVCALYGQHPVLHAGTGDGTLAREAYRRFQRATLEPYARLISEQFGRVLGLGRPVTFDFSRLRASDMAGSARTFRALAGKAAIIEPERALVLSGIVDPGQGA